MKEATKYNYKVKVNKIFNFVGIQVKVVFNVNINRIFRKFLDCTTDTNFLGTDYRGRNVVVTGWGFDEVSFVIKIPHFPDLPFFREVLFVRCHHCHHGGAAMRFHLSIDPHFLDFLSLMRFCFSLILSSSSKGW